MEIDPARWHREPPRIERVAPQTYVLREDLLPGGSKMRFLPFLLGDARELVFGGPFCGHAPLALSIIGEAFGRRVTLFYAQRKVLHPKQAAALSHGARIIPVNPGYMTNVQAKARAYCALTGAKFLPLGFDLPEAEAPFLDYIATVRRRVGDLPEVWCATGSGMLARCLARGFPNSRIHAVPVGLASRHEAQEFGANVTFHPTELKFEQEIKARPPFPSCPNYDAKAWAVFQAQRSGAPALFWNVAGPI